jgi:multiple sugar transport system substrate-binding protein
VALSEGGEWFAGDNADKLTNALTVVSNWVKDGYCPPYTDYPGAVALFTAGQAGFHVNGVWEVPTLNDLTEQNKLGFEWGAIELPVFFGHPSTYEDSHAFAIPNNVGKEPDPAKRAAVLEIIKWMEAHALFWATAGHIPANKHVTDSAEYKAMQPQATYAVLTENGIFDPKSKFAGVAGAVFEAAANNFTAAVNGEVEPAEAVQAMRDELAGLE